MDKAIKEIIIPFLRNKGFKGSFPHFRRENNDKLNLLNFQFSLYSSSFVVNIANCSVNGMTTSDGELIKPAKCQVPYLKNRLRVGSIKNRRDYWYDFDKQLIFGDIFKKRAKEFINNWEEAEQWWRNNDIELLN
ncbi:DUF4304 domain-containing protein [Aestuariibaculum sp. M13]|uniref:DUF4304 domain-containing protein n=2 Tax=Aestuariibaculum lutulentum TaxID=2920935 RepID=A0ABS9RIJ7_9FLAO|nr:DUF4304 domain-containing protein [Aestuariibaculum sp. M13]MCH4552712.1 DUF4304 domain-containing protein [Aestuariibaculum lutulentum]MCR8668061.1 DUF4304 domain-containing protein [Aestuariibaculum sp. M13]